MAGTRETCPAYRTNSASKATRPEDDYLRQQGALAFISFMTAPRRGTRRHLNRWHVSQGQNERHRPADSCTGTNTSSRIHVGKYLRGLTDRNEIGRASCRERV